MERPNHAPSQIPQPIRNTHTYTCLHAYIHAYIHAAQCTQPIHARSWHLGDMYAHLPSGFHVHNLTPWQHKCSEQVCMCVCVCINVCMYVYVVCVHVEVGFTCGGCHLVPRHVHLYWRDVYSHVGVCAN